MKRAIDILDRAIALIGRGWTQRAPARTTGGRPCGPTDPNAVAWCITGAIYHRESGADTLDHLAAERFVRRVLGFDLDPKKVDSITLWNDDRSRVVEDVLQALCAGRALAASAAMDTVN